MMPDRVRSVITLGKPVRGRPQGDQRLARFMRWQAAAAPTKRIRVSADRWRGRRRCDHGDLQPHRRHLRLAGLHGTDHRDLGEHRGREQPLRMGHHPAVVYAVADRLAQPEGKWAPFDRSGWRSLVYPNPNR